MNQSMKLAIRHRNDELIQELIDDGESEVNASDDQGPPGTEGYTPLHLASFLGHDECTKVLLENGANIDQVDIYLKPPLFYSCYQNNLVCSKLLIEAGASIDTAFVSLQDFLHGAYGIEDGIKQLLAQYVRI